MSTALVTGAYGFVGGHLRTALAAGGWTVIGLGRAKRADEGYIRIDLADSSRVPALAERLDELKPDVVFHLAASPSSKASSGDPSHLVASTVLATMNLCGAMIVASSRARLVLAGSSAQYGALPRELNPVSEDSPCRPVNAYGHAKSASESTAMAFAAAGALEVIPARAFNHIGPGEPDATVASAFANRIAAVLAGLSDIVEVGDLDAVRDFVDVRDVARGYIKLAEHGGAGRVYNLCSGRETTVGSLLDALLMASGLDRSVVRLRNPQPGTTRRPDNIPYQVGSPARVEAEIGWHADRTLMDSASDLLTAVQRDQKQ